MFRYMVLISFFQTFAGATSAHEFWIEPKEMFMSENTPMQPVLMIGEHPDGQAYRFQPQAYAQTLWSGPKNQVELSRLPLSGPAFEFDGFGPGLHSLAVSTFPQELTYDSADQFRAFLAEIGQEDLLSSAQHGPVEEGNINESYRRYAKTLVHFADQQGEDRRVGLQREWVWKDGAFKLFDGDHPKAGQKTQVYCRSGLSPEAMTTLTFVTDDEGAIKPDLPRDARCLINAVFLRYDSVVAKWRSDWVSLFLCHRSHMGIECLE
ncbi:MAG: hypothetical protein AAF252_01110 [Pseudomonadota bacterium]